MEALDEASLNTEVKDSGFGLWINVRATGVSRWHKGIKQVDTESTKVCRSEFFEIPLRDDASVSNVSRYQTAQA
jgi:hypothetical protein